MRKSFISDVSHELKTPIALIQGYSEGLIENVNTDDESRKCGATWYASSRGAATRNTIIVDDLYACPWWLRTPWLYQIDVSAVNFGGTMAGGYCTDSGLGVRPAIWINLNADVF